MTKKQKIIELFDSIEWTTSPSGGVVKIITGEMFDEAGLYHAVENPKQHCDIIYARRIIQGLGHRVLIGQAFHIYKGKME